MSDLNAAERQIIQIIRKEKDTSKERTLAGIRAILDRYDVPVQALRVPGPGLRDLTLLERVEVALRGHNDPRKARDEELHAFLDAHNFERPPADDESDGVYVRIAYTVSQLRAGLASVHEQLDLAGVPMMEEVDGIPGSGVLNRIQWLRAQQARLNEGLYREVDRLQAKVEAFMAEEPSQPSVSTLSDEEARPTSPPPLRYVPFTDPMPQVIRVYYKR